MENLCQGETHRVSGELFLNINAPITYLLSKLVLLDMTEIEQQLYKESI